MAPRRGWDLTPNMNICRIFQSGIASLSRAGSESIFVSRQRAEKEKKKGHSCSRWIEPYFKGTGELVCTSWHMLTIFCTGWESGSDVCRAHNTDTDIRSGIHATLTHRTQVVPPLSFRNGTQRWAAPEVTQRRVRLKRKRSFQKEKEKKREGVWSLGFSAFSLVVRRYG